MAAKNQDSHGSSSHGAIKTKFPVARIKKIMQADEDVGKVAQVTPLVVSRALELFMASLIMDCCDEARARNSKRVQVIHFKQAIVSNPQYDFLEDMVSNVADPGNVDTNGEQAEEAKASTKKRKKEVTD